VIVQFAENTGLFERLHHHDSTVAHVLFQFARRYDPLTSCLTGYEKDLALPLVLASRLQNRDHCYALIQLLMLLSHCPGFPYGQAVDSCSNRLR
jgi:hypothetical protein